MGAVLSRVLLTAAVALTMGFAAGRSYHQSTSGAGVGARPFSTAYHARQKAARKAADVVFQAIVEAEEAAASYISALSAAASEAAAKGYDAVMRAAAEASCLVITLIERVYGSAAALAAQVRLDGVNVPIGVADVSTVVNSTFDVIKGVCSAIVPVASCGTTDDVPSPVEKRARSSTLRVMGLLAGIKSSEKMVGFTIPMPVKVTIGVLAVVGELALAVTSSTETSV